MGAFDKFDKGSSSCDERFGIEALAPRGGVGGRIVSFGKGSALLELSSRATVKKCLQLLGLFDIVVSIRRPSR